MDSGVKIVCILVLLKMTALVSADFAEEALRAHNEYRRTHNALPMRLNSQLSRKAQQWANKIAGLGRLKHSGPGENLAYRCNPRETAKDFVKYWYDEICKYNFNRQGFSSATGHFTQLVWKKSEELGIGNAQGTVRYRGRRLTCTFVVARYKPSGNVRGAFEKNVEKGSFRSSYCNNVSSRSLPQYLAGKL